MPETATAAATTATETSAAEVPRTPTGGVDVHAYAAKAQAAIAAERAAADAPNEPVEPATEGDKGKAQPTKDPKTGKFVKAGDKTSDKGAAADDGAAQTTDTQAPDSEANQEHADEAIPDERDISLAAWRRRAAQDPIKTVELVFGKKIEEIRIPSKYFAGLRDERRKVTARAKQAQALVENAVREFTPLQNARKAWEAGDVEAAVKHAFGCSVADLGKRHIASVSSAPPQDPRVDKLIRDNEELRQQLQQQRQQEQQVASQRSQQEQLANLQTMLTDSDEPHIARVAGRRVFQNAVIEHLRANFDPSTKTSIPVIEAAQLAYDDIYGDDLDNQGAAAPPAKARTAAPVASKTARTPHKGRNLDTTRAAEPAPPVKHAPGSPELLRHYARLAAQAEMEERAKPG